MPLVSSLRQGSSFWRVGALAVFFIVVAVVIFVFSDRIPGDYVIVLLGLLAVVGVFSLFALAAGLFRFPSVEDGQGLHKAVVDSLPYGAVVTDREGRISYANARYGEFPGALGNGVPQSEAASLKPPFCASITFCISATSLRALAVAAGTVSVSSFSAAAGVLAIWSPRL